MKKIFRISSIIASFAVIAFIVPTVVSAQSVNEARCTAGDKNLESLITKVSTATAAHQQTYSQIMDSVVTIQTSAETSEFDEAKLDAAYTAAQADLQTYTEKASAYSASLTTTKSAACGTEAAAFTTALTSSRTALSELKTSETNLQKTLKEDMITALTEYSTWLQQNSSNNSEEN